MAAALTWVVIAVLGTGHGIGTCGHEHATADEATACPWTPDPWPRCCDLLVRQVRAGDRREPRPARRMEARQQLLPFERSLCA
jgi:hypothetical protein